MVRERGKIEVRWRSEADRLVRGVPGLASLLTSRLLVFAMASTALPALASPATMVDRPATAAAWTDQEAGDALRSTGALRQEMQAKTTELDAGMVRANTNLLALSQAAHAGPTPPPPDFSVAPTAIEYGVLVLVGGLLLAWLVVVGRGFRACTLYVHGRPFDARVVRRFRRFGAAVVEYEFWSLQGRRTGIAPARCAGGDTVHIVFNDAHPDWHRPRALLFDDLLMAGTFFLAPLTLFLLRLAGTLWEVVMHRIRG
jgi:hypothetical protein